LKKSRNAISATASVLTFGWAGTKNGKLRLRRIACRLVGQALIARSRGLDLAGLTTVLAIAPHPDDETLGCGGTLALLARRHPSVHVLFITDGAASHPGHPIVSPQALAATRLEEARRATQLLGIHRQNVSFMGEQDGSLGHIAEAHRRELTRRMAGALAAIRPDAILLPGRSDGSCEHEAAFALVRDAVELSGGSPRILEFPIWSWWNSLRLAGTLIARARIWRVDVRSVHEAKAAALACYVSQTKAIPPDTDPALPEGFALMFLGRYEYYIEH
jgi:LmbE family N-acetylglucosaminyl deacetylase